MTFYARIRFSRAVDVVRNTYACISQHPSLLVTKGMRVERAYLVTRNGRSVENTSCRRFTRTSGICMVKIEFVETV